MRQDYLSICYSIHISLFHFAHSEVIFYPSNSCWENSVSFWRHMIIYYHLPTNQVKKLYNILYLISEKQSLWSRPVINHCRKTKIRNLYSTHMYLYTCIEGLFIESWSAGSVFGRDVDRGAHSWWVEDKSTLASSIIIEAEYPVQVEHEEIA